MHLHLHPACGLQTPDFHLGAAERDPLHQGIIVERSKLQQREFTLDLTSRLGKTQVVTHNTPLSQQVASLTFSNCLDTHKLGQDYRNLSRAVPHYNEQSLRCLCPAPVRPTCSYM